jgi:hypothetical protein
LQLAGRRLALHPIEPVIPGKAMLRHRINLSPVAQFIVLQPADDGKQQWRMARPRRAGLPKQLNPSSAFQRAQFSAFRRDGRRHRVIAKRKAVLGHAGNGS